MAASDLKDESPRQAHLFELDLGEVPRPRIPEWHALEMPARLPRSERGLDLLDPLLVELLRRIDKLVLAIRKVAPHHACAADADLERISLLLSVNLGLLRLGGVGAEAVVQVQEAVRTAAEEAASLRRDILESLPPHSVGRVLEAEARINLNDETVCQRHDLQSLARAYAALLGEHIEPAEVGVGRELINQAMEEALAESRRAAEAMVLPSRHGLRGLLKLLPVEWLDSLVEVHVLPHDSRRSERERRLVEHLTNTDVLEDILWGELPGAALEALSYLLDRGGVSLISTFSRRFGADNDSRYLWGLAEPTSLAGWLRAFGLAFVGAGEHKGREQRLLVVPRELREPLAEVLFEDDEADDDDPEEVLASIQERVVRWVEELEGCAAWRALDADMRADIPFLTEVFARSMYLYQGETPESWSPEGLASCCLEDLPRKVTAGREFFDAVPHRLDALLAWLGERGHITGAAVLRKTLAEIATDIPKAAADRSLWDPAKAVAMAADRAGFDISDTDALQGFFEIYNRRLSRPEPPPPPVRRTKVGRNQACPCGSGEKYKRCCGR